MEEKRKFMRFGSTIDIKYRVPHRAIEGLTVSRDISREGIGFYVNRRLPVRNWVELELNIPGEAMPIFAAGRIAWLIESGKQERADFNAGLEIVKMNSLDKSRLLGYAYSQWREKTKGGECGL